MKKIFICFTLCALYLAGCSNGQIVDDDGTTIIPQKCDILAGQDFPFALEGKNLQGTITWSATKGTVNPTNGPSIIYSAPQEPGPVVITAIVESGNRQNTYNLFCEIISPQTALASESPATILPEDTLEPIATETVAPVLNGLENNCLNSDIWTPYTIITQFPRENNCWNLSSRGISVYNDELLFAVKNASEQSGSLYILLPEVATISFDLIIDEYTTGGNNGNFVVGVGNMEDWLQSGKFIFLRLQEPTAPVYFVYGSSVTLTGENWIQTYTMGSSQKIVFEIKNLILDIYIADKKVGKSITLTPEERQVFWIGYRLPMNSELVATISNLVIDDQNRR